MVGWVDLSFVCNVIVGIKVLTSVMNISINLIIFLPNLIPLSFLDLFLRIRSCALMVFREHEINPQYNHEINSFKPEIMVSSSSGESLATLLPNLFIEIVLI